MTDLRRAVQHRNVVHRTSNPSSQESAVPYNTVLSGRSSGRPDGAAERIYALVEYSGPPNRALKPTTLFVTILAGQESRQTGGAPQPHRTGRRLSFDVRRPSPGTCH